MRYHQTEEQKEDERDGYAICREEMRNAYTILVDKLQVTSVLGGDTVGGKVIL
jgi:hypothetical protein